MTAAGGDGARRVLLDVAALERAFEDTSGETRRYLHVGSGTVTTLHHGVSDAAAFTSLERDSEYLRIEPVSRRQQYRWMQEYLAAIEDRALAARLREVTSGQGAFSRFQVVLARDARAHRAWGAFRRERLHSFIAAFLRARGVLVSTPLVTPDRTLESRRQRLADAAARLGFGDLTTLVATARFLAAARDMSERARAAAAVEDHRDDGESQSALP